MSIMQEHGASIQAGARLAQRLGNEHSPRNTLQIKYDDEGSRTKRKYTIIDADTFIFHPQAQRVNSGFYGCREFFDSRTAIHVHRNETSRWEAVKIVISKPLNPRKRGNRDRGLRAMQISRVREALPRQIAPYFQRSPIKCFVSKKDHISGRPLDRTFMISDINTLGTLDQLDWTERPAFAKDLLNICMEMANALDHLHRARLSHTNLQMDNIGFQIRANGSLGIRIGELDSIEQDNRDDEETNVRRKADNMAQFGKVIETLIFTLMISRDQELAPHQNLLDNLGNLADHLQRRSGADRPTANECLQRMQLIYQAWRNVPSLPRERPLEVLPEANSTEEVSEVLSEEASAEGVSLEEERRLALEARLPIIAQYIEQEGPGAGFTIPQQMLRFSMNQLLQLYNAEHPVTRLSDHFAYANVPQTHRALFDVNDRSLRNIARRYSSDRPYYRPSRQQQVAEQTMSRIYDYIRIRREEVAQGSPEEEELKELIRNIIERIIDSHVNCVDQVNTQLEGIALDLIGGNIGPRDNTAVARHARILLKAQRDFYQYRSRVLTEAVAYVDAQRQQGLLINPRTQMPFFQRREAHMADFNLLVRASLGDIFDDDSELARVGAQFGDMVGDGEQDRNDMIQAAVVRFYDQYNPLQYMENELRTYYGILRNLRSDLLIWAGQQYGTDVLEDTPETERFGRAISEAYDELPATEGGNLTHPAILALMEAAGIIERRDTPEEYQEETRRLLSSTGRSGQRQVPREQVLEPRRARLPREQDLEARRANVRANLQQQSGQPRRGQGRQPQSVRIPVDDNMRRILGLSQEPRQGQGLGTGSSRDTWVQNVEESRARLENLSVHRPVCLSESEARIVRAEATRRARVLARLGRQPAPISSEPLQIHSYHVNRVSPDVTLFRLQRTSVQIIHGDLFDQGITIVNAANQSCLGGSGIDGEVHRRAGAGLLQECRALPQMNNGVRCETGQAVITRSHNLREERIPFIIHTVGPDRRQRGVSREEQQQQLYNSYYNSLRTASEHDITQIAFPGISIGIYQYPIEEATEIALRAIQDYCRRHPDDFSEIRLVYPDQNIYNTVGEIIDRVVIED